MNTKSSTIVVGIDFGTTHSGVSWAYPGRKDIRVITNWPNPKIKTPSNDKVPSSFSYGKNGKPEHWGYSNTQKDETFKWFKILLEPNHKYNDSVKEVKESQKLLKELNKDPIEVVADYLRILWDYTMRDIGMEVKSEDWRRDYALKVVLTVPAMWSDAAKDKTKKAAIQAGMPRDSITLITEPEAAALAVIRDMADDETLGVGNTFVVCDAGGGTVDLISYTIESVMPLQIKETVRGEGGLCGSVYLNIGFKNYIETLVGKDAYESLPQASRRNMETEFDQTVKRTFNENDDSIHTVDLYYVDDDPENGIDDNTIVLKKSALKTIFDQVFLQIEGLIQSQISQVQKQGEKVEAILLVGGFGESPYLYDRVYASHRGNGIHVMRVQGAWSAICRGATLSGLEGISGSLGRPPKVISRVSRFSYGFCVSHLFDPAIHDLADRFIDPADGRYRANNQMSWLVKAGDVIEEDKVLRTPIIESVQVRFWDAGDRNFSTSLCFCEDKIAPTKRTSSVHELCEVSYSVSNTKLYMEPSYKNPTTREKWRDCTFALLILLKKSSLDFVVMYGEDLVGAVEANYKEDF